MAPASSYASRSGANDDEGVPRAPLRRIHDAFGHFEGILNLGSDCRRFFNALQARRPLLPFVMPEVGRLGARSDNQ